MYLAVFLFENTHVRSFRKHARKWKLDSLSRQTFDLLGTCDPMKDQDISLSKDTACAFRTPSSISFFGTLLAELRLCNTSFRASISGDGQEFYTVVSSFIR